MNVLLKEEEGKRKGKNAQPQWHKTWLVSFLSWTTAGKRVHLAVRRLLL